MDEQATGGGEHGGDNLACELCFGRELKYIVQRARGDDGQKRKAQHGVVDIHAGMGDQRGRPAPVEGAEDLQRARDDKAGEHGESAHARGGHGVDAALGRVVHGVELDGNLLDDGRQHIGGGESRERQTDVGKQRLHVNTAYRRYVQNLTYDSRDATTKGGRRLDNTVIAKVRAGRWLSVRRHARGRIDGGRDGCPRARDARDVQVFNFSH